LLLNLEDRFMVFCRLFLITVASLALAGCLATSFAVKTTSGCGIGLSEKWAAEQLSEVTWSGACEGGAHGFGQLLMKHKNGGTSTYDGVMKNGVISGQGVYRRPDGFRKEGLFDNFLFYNGKIYNPHGLLLFDGAILTGVPDPTGKMLRWEDMRYGEGTFYLTDGVTVIKNARGDGSAGMFTGLSMINPATGAGLAWGQVERRGEVIAYFVEGRRYRSADDFHPAMLAAITARGAAMLAQAGIATAPSARMPQSPGSPATSRVPSAPGNRGPSFDVRILDQGRYDDRAESCLDFVTKGDQMVFRNRCTDSEVVLLVLHCADAMESGGPRLNAVFNVNHTFVANYRLRHSQEQGVVNLRSATGGLTDVKVRYFAFKYRYGDKIDTKKSWYWVPGQHARASEKVHQSFSQGSPRPLCKNVSLDAAWESAR
jgi:hypothetical protein